MLPAEFVTLFTDVFIYLMAVVAIASGVGVITNKTPVYSVLLLVINFFSIAALYLSLQAEFLAVVQIIVYAGAIMVLFLFVIMLLNLENASPDEMAFDAKKGLAFISGLAILAMVLYALNHLISSGLPVPPTPSYSYGRVEPIGKLLITDFVFPFEMISVILLSALIGALVIAKKHKP
jgi:NADH-quinone oxidoreductase subunit J